jgi:hypothetical protein
LSEPAPGRLVVRNEFGVVAVELTGAPGHERLRIEDLRSGAAVELDALELECLAWSTHADLAPLLDPSLTRWPHEDPAPADDQSDTHEDS